MRNFYNFVCFDLRFILVKWMNCLSKYCIFKVNVGRYLLVNKRLSRKYVFIFLSDIIISFLLPNKHVSTCLFDHTNADRHIRKTSWRLSIILTWHRKSKSVWFIWTLFWNYCQWHFKTSLCERIKFIRSLRTSIETLYGQYK